MTDHELQQQIDAEHDRRSFVSRGALLLVVLAGIGALVSFLLCAWRFGWLQS